MAQTQIVNTSPTAKYVANDQTVVFDNGKNQEKANLISQKENNGNTLLLSCFQDPLAPK